MVGILGAQEWSLKKNCLECSTKSLHDRSSDLMTSFMQLLNKNILIYIQKYLSECMYNQLQIKFVLIIGLESKKQVLLGLVFFLWFFPGKSLKFSSRSISIFRDSICDIVFKFNSFLFLKGRQIILSKRKNVKVLKTMIKFWFRKWNLIFRFSSVLKKLLLDRVF